MGALGANPGPLFVGLQSATLPVIPAKAGTQPKQENSDASRIHFQRCWVPACAGMTVRN